MKPLLLLSFSLALLTLTNCGPSGQLALPEQNIVSRFELEGDLRRSWQWTETGSPVVLSLEEKGSYELLWCIREKPRKDRLRAPIRSLLLAPAFPSRGPQGLQEVRFSPSGRTILVQEHSRDGSKFQVLLFTQSQQSSAWFSRPLTLGEPAKTKLRKLDDNSRVPALLSGSTPPQILRLDDDLVIYQVDKETRSLPLY